jgi:putative ABC transport system substrate-binding protein
MRRLLAVALPLVLAVIAPPAAVEAQQAKPAYRIGVLSPELLPPGMLETIRSEFHDLGYAQGSVAIELRNADGDIERLARLADELVRLKVDVILTVTTPAAQAAKAATATVPIVMIRIADPVKNGLVPRFSHPRGNITGISNLSDVVSAKRIELLKEALPGISRIAALWDGRNVGATSVVDGMEPASARFGIELLRLPLRSPDDLPGLFQAATTARAEAIMIVDDAVISRHRIEIVDLASKHRLPIVPQYREFAGGPFAYGPDNAALYRRAVQYVDRILKGTRPSDLPIEQPTKFELVINLKIARALGLEIPASLLARADEVIE